MLKRLGITVAISIGILGYVYLLKYFFSLTNLWVSSLGPWIAGVALLEFILITGLWLIRAVIYGLRWIFTGDSSLVPKGIIQNEDKDYTESLKELDELFPGKSNEMEML